MADLDSFPPSYRWTPPFLERLFRDSTSSNQERGGYLAARSNLPDHSQDPEAATRRLRQKTIVMQRYSWLMPPLPPPPTLGTKQYAALPPVH